MTTPPPPPATLHDQAEAWASQYVAALRTATAVDNANTRFLAVVAYLKTARSPAGERKG